MARGIEEYRERLRGGTTRPLPDYPEGSPQRTCMENDALVWAMVGRYYATHDDDMIQAGRLGSLRAIAKFDPAKARYSTYAARWIWNQASVERRQRELIRVPAYLRQSYAGGKHAGRLKEAAAAKAMQFHGIGHEGGEVRDVPAANPDEAAQLAMLDELREAIAAAMPALCHADRQGRLPEIMARRFGLDGREPEMLSTIGERLGISRERTRQLVARGLKVLRVHLERSMAS